MNGKEAVWEKVEAFRRQYLVGKLAQLPVDILTVAEIELRLDPIRFDDLWTKYRRDAALTPDFTGIYVDAESYDLWEKGPLWKQRRLRFSVAHEIGHLVLHRETGSKISFQSFDDFARWTNSTSSEKYTLEQEANEFAGRLLVPLDRLKHCLDSFGPSLEKVMPHWFTSMEVRAAFAESATNVFQVSQQSIEARLDREGLWPAC